MSSPIDRTRPSLGAEPSPADRWHALTAFQRDTLTAIAELIAADDHRPYGLAIKECLEARYDEPVNHRWLYPNLDTLVENDLVAKSEYDDRTNRYELTDAGIAVLDAGRDRLATALAALNACDTTETEEGSP